MGSLRWKPTNAGLVEQKESQQWDYGTEITCLKVYRGPFALCLANMSPKGAFGTGGLAGFVIDRCQVVRENNGIGKLTETWKIAAGSGSGQILPPMTMSLTPSELAPHLNHHPRYAALDEADRANVYDALNGSDPKAKNDAYNALNAIVNSTTKTAALDLLAKLRKGLETYYLAYFKYSYSVFYWGLPNLSVGGHLETPDGPLQGHLGTLGCLRVADELAWTGSYYTLTCSWLCAPEGHWDTTIYGA